jgi:hypothetical protein
MNNGPRIAVLRLVRPSRNRPVRGYGDKFHGLVIVPSAVAAIRLDVGPNDVAIAARQWDSTLPEMSMANTDMARRKAARERIVIRGSSWPVFFEGRGCDEACVLC